MSIEQSFHTAYCCGYRRSYNSHMKGQDIYFACVLQALKFPAIYVTWSLSCSFALRIIKQRQNLLGAILQQVNAKLIRGGYDVQPPQHASAHPISPHPLPYKIINPFWIPVLDGQAVENRKVQGGRGWGGQGSWYSGASTLRSMQERIISKK